MSKIQKTGKNNIYASLISKEQRQEKKKGKEGKKNWSDEYWTNMEGSTRSGILQRLLYQG